MIYTIDEAEKWFLGNSDGSVECFNNGKYKTCDSYLEAESFYTKENNLKDKIKDLESFWEKGGLGNSSDKDDLAKIADYIEKRERQARREVLETIVLTKEVTKLMDNKKYYDALMEIREKSLNFIIEANKE